MEGRQDLVDGKAQTYGQSITDACIGWEDSEDCCNNFLMQLLLDVKRQ